MKSKSFVNGMLKKKLTIYLMLHYHFLPDNPLTPADTGVP